MIMPFLPYIIMGVLAVVGLGVLWAFRCKIPGLSLLLCSGSKEDGDDCGLGLDCKSGHCCLGEEGKNVCVPESKLNRGMCPGASAGSPCTVPTDCADNLGKHGNCCDGICTADKDMDKDTVGIRWCPNDPLNPTNKGKKAGESCTVPTDCWDALEFRGGWCCVGKCTAKKDMINNSCPPREAGEYCDLPTDCKDYGNGGDCCGNVCLAEKDMAMDFAGTPWCPTGVNYATVSAANLAASTSDNVKKLWSVIQKETDSYMQWTAKDDPEGWFRMYHPKSGKCLDAGGSNESAKLNTCTMFKDNFWQQWKKTGDGLLLENRHTGKCLDSGKAIPWMGTCANPNNANVQYKRFPRRARGGAFKNNRNDKCLDANTEGSFYQGGCNTGDFQRWLTSGTKQFGG